MIGGRRRRRVIGWLSAALIGGLIGVAAPVPAGAAATARYAGGGVVLPAGSGPATPYGSEVRVSGAPGPVTDVDVILHDVKLEPGAGSDGPDLMLVGPGGQHVVVLGDRTVSTELSTLVFDDEGVDNCRWSSFVGAFPRCPPVDLVPDEPFPAPAPSTVTAGGALSVFDGTDPNGAWSLFVVGADGSSGSVGWWELSFSLPPLGTPTFSAPIDGSLHTSTGYDISGTGPAGSSIRLRDNYGAEIGVAVDDTGRWHLPGSEVARSFPAPQGWRQLTAQAWDLHGNLSNLTGPLSVRVDSKPPIVGVQIDGGAARTTTTDVVVTLTAEDLAPGTGLDRIRLSRDGGQSWTSWTPFVTTTTFSLGTGICGERWITAQVRDRAGNVATASDTIEMVCQGVGSVTPDLRAPRITRTAPAAGTSWVRVRRSVAAWATEPLLPGSVNASTVWLRRHGFRRHIPVVVTYVQGSDERILLDPGRPLRHHTMYVAVMSTGLRDVSGNRLDQSSAPGRQPYRWRFTTG